MSGLPTDTGGGREGGGGGGGGGGHPVEEEPRVPVLRAVSLARQELSLLLLVLQTEERSQLSQLTTNQNPKCLPAHHGCAGDLLSVLQRLNGVSIAQGSLLPLACLGRVGHVAVGGGGDGGGGGGGGHQEEAGRSRAVLRQVLLGQGGERDGEKQDWDRDPHSTVKLRSRDVLRVLL